MTAEMLLLPLPSFRRRSFHLVRETDARQAKMDGAEGDREREGGREGEEMLTQSIGWTDGATGESDQAAQWQIDGWRKGWGIDESGRGRGRGSGRQIRGKKLGRRRRR